jgi:hypothetical protein
MLIGQKFLELFDRFIATDFVTSQEGATNSGLHETAVAKFFSENGFPITEKIVVVKTQRSQKEIYIMNRATHCPTDSLEITRPDGFYTILQPYSKTGRGAMNPSPDLYLIYIENNKVKEWLGIECKSSKDSLCPMWNEHLPRDFSKGNILYFFSGFDKATKQKLNTLFTSTIFFNGQDGSVIETKFWDDVRTFMKSQWETNYAKAFPMVDCKLRQFCGQFPFTKTQTAEMNEKSRIFLQTLI